MSRQCIQCPRPVEARSLCRRCYDHAQQDGTLLSFPPKAVPFEDVEFMAATGRTAEEIEAAAGVRIDSVVRRLYRHGRADLAYRYQTSPSRRVAA